MGQKELKSLDAASLLSSEDYTDFFNNCDNARTFNMTTKKRELWHVKTCSDEALTI